MGKEPNKEIPMKLLKDQGNFQMLLKQPDSELYQSRQVHRLRSHPTLAQAK